MNHYDEPFERAANRIGLVFSPIFTFITIVFGHVLHDTAGIETWLKLIGLSALGYALGGSIAATALGLKAQEKSFWARPWVIEGIFHRTGSQPAGELPNVPLKLDDAAN
jgi:hypothetical protein